MYSLIDSANFQLYSTLASWAVCSLSSRKELCIRQLLAILTIDQQLVPLLSVFSESQIVWPRLISTQWQRFTLKSFTNSPIPLYWHIMLCMYHIVPGKHPWLLTSQVPKLEGGRLHGGGAWMVWLFWCKRPPRMQSQLPDVLNRPTLLLCSCFDKASLAVEKAVLC